MKACSIITGIPYKDVIRLKAKHDIILQSLRKSYKSLYEMCFNEPKKYQKVLITSFFDDLLDFFYPKQKVDIMLGIMYRMCIGDDKELQKLFEKIKKQELNEVYKNR